MQKALASAGSALAKSTQALLDRRQINPNTEENSQWDTILTSQIDAIALLRHAMMQIFSYHLASRNAHEVGDPEILTENSLFSTKAPTRGGQTRATPRNRKSENTERGEQELLTHSQMVNRLNSLEVIKRIYGVILPSLKEHLQIASFEGGWIRKHFSHWQKITTDSEILDMVSGTHIEFQSIPAQTRPKISCKFSPQECTTIQTEVSNLIRKSVIRLKHIMTQGSLSPQSLFGKRKTDETSLLFVDYTHNYY